MSIRVFGVSSGLRLRLKDEHMDLTISVLKPEAFMFHYRQLSNCVDIDFGHLQTFKPK